MLPGGASTENVASAPGDTLPTQEHADLQVSLQGPDSPRSASHPFTSLHSPEAQTCSF